MAATRGVIYVAVRDATYRRLARESIWSLRRARERVDVAVVCDDDADAATTAREFGDGVRRIVVPRDADAFGSRAIKTQLHRLTPFDETLYLDCDTLVVWPLDQIWQHLRSAEVALALDAHPTVQGALAAARGERRGTAAEWEATRASMTSAAAPYFNGGVLLWRRSEASARF